MPKKGLKSNLGSSMKAYKKKKLLDDQEKRNYERTNKGFFGEQYLTPKEKKQVKKGAMGI